MAGDASLDKGRRAASILLSQGMLAMSVSNARSLAVSESAGTVGCDSI